MVPGMGAAVPGRRGAWGHASSRRTAFHGEGCIGGFLAESTGKAFFCADGAAPSLPTKTFLKKGCWISYPGGRNSVESWGGNCTAHPGSYGDKK